MLVFYLLSFFLSFPFIFLFVLMQSYISILVKHAKPFFSEFLALSVCLCERQCPCAIVMCHVIVGVIFQLGVSVKSYFCHFNLIAFGKECLNLIFC